MSVNSFHEVGVDTPPVNPVLTTAQAKAFMRVDSSTDDSYINNVVTVATKRVEDYLNRSLITQTLTCYFKSYSNCVYLPNTPVQSVTTVTQISSDNSENVLVVDSGYYVKGVKDKYLDMGSAGNYLPAGHSPNDLLAGYALKVTYIAGYGDDSTDIPEPITEAIKRMVLHLYDNRDEIVIGAVVNKIPMGITMLLEPYRNIDL